MPNYVLTAGMVSDTLLDQHSTPYLFSNGSLDGMSCDITATTDGLDNTSTPYNSPSEDIIDVGSTMTVEGTTYTITDELGSYATVHYDNGSGPQDTNGFISHYTLTDGTDTIYVSFAVLESGSPITVDSSYELLGFTFDDDIQSGPNLGLMPLYDDQGALEWGAPDGTKLPCFTAGTEVLTSKGMVKVENIQAGDMVKTFDNGLQEVKMVASRKVLAMGELQPVIFDKGAIGNDKPLVVSQKHRMYVGAFPEYLRKQFGPYQDNMIQAVELCNGGSIRLATHLKTVEYFHIMFDDHQLVFAHGTVSESWQPTQNALKQHPELAEELNAIFPGIADRRFSDDGAQVRNEVSLNPERIADARQWMSVA